jgi:hypothetical protein
VAFEWLNLKVEIFVLWQGLIDGEIIKSSLSMWGKLGKLLPTGRKGGLKTKTAVEFYRCSSRIKHSVIIFEVLSN